MEADVSVRRVETRNSVRRFVAVSGRVALTALALILQLVVFGLLLVRSSEFSPWLGTLSGLISVGVVAFILNSHMQVEYKLAWIIPIMLAPLFGGAFYLIFGARTGTRRQMLHYSAIQDLAALDQESAVGALAVLPGTLGEQPPELEPATTAESLPVISIDPDAARQIAHLESMGPFRAYRDTETTYYPVGEDAFAAMLEALEGAKRWIAMEYFIVSEGQMWRKVLDVLSRKAAEGVQIWFMYDDLGSLWTLPEDFIKDLRNAGIRVRPFNKLGPGLTLRYNNRDHRKFTIVDGVIAFTGGINIADEYINAIQRFGHWKDTAIRLRGSGAWGMASLFFTIWDLVSGEQTDLAALHASDDEVAAQPGGAGVVVSYDDTPFDDVSLGWTAYRGMMSRAKFRVDLTTPYLVPTNEMITVFTALARSGVQVRIITPGIPDKAYVYAVTRSNYRPLVEAGVEVYEYSPGFIHAKQMIVDDDTAVIGTINFDFRSFYLHQEDAVWMYQTPAIADMSADFEATLEKCRRVGLTEVRSTPWWRRAVWLVLRTFSPLM
ncbi:phospholipase D-like domain-containing protein [Brooklawnia sp.]|uniref:phospholipase D-like domain-containing protein n=1 Tax=Brooklawnia sp. TaxID=2699740 RepID=UPI00311FB9C8